MKKSIKRTFTLIFVSIVAVLLLLMYIFNVFFLQSYYENRKIHMLEVAYETIDQVVEIAQKNDGTIFDLINEEYGHNVEDSPTIAIFRTLNDRSNIDIVLSDTDGSKTASTSREGEWLSMKLQMYLLYRDAFAEGTEPLLPNPKQKTGETGTGQSSAGSRNISGPGIQILRQNTNYTIQKFYDRRSGSEYLECWGTFSDGDTNFLMSMPVASIQEGAAVSSRFNLLTGIILLIAGSVAVYLATARMTRPIHEMAQLSERMSNLDFSARYEGSAEDEIGLLGASMNSMSDKLESAIDSLKDANEQLHAANSCLQEDIHEKEKIDQMRRDFIADVSHELKTPIALIEGYAEGLQEGIADDPESRDYYCGVIVDEAARMNKLVRQLTSLIHYESGEIRMEKETFDLGDLIRSMINVNKIKLEEANARLTTDLEDNSLITADEFRMEEVFANYMSNALNHLGGDRQIIVDLHTVPAEDGKEAEAPELMLCVFNEGEPIPEESLAHLWEKFYKVDKARTRAYGGSGIGLSIVRAIMEAHGGGYGVCNIPAGAYVPGAEAAGANASGAQESGSLGGRKVYQTSGGVEFRATIKKNGAS